MHLAKKDKTRTITYRLPENILDEINTEAMEKNISANVLIRQILERHISWDRFANKIGMIPIPKSIIEIFGDKIEGNKINDINKTIKPFIKESVLFMKGKYDLKRCIEALEDYIKASGIKSDHRMEGNLHHFIIQHELGMQWSLFAEQLLKEIFHDFVPDINVQSQTTDKTVIITVPLGSDFNEHDY
jgi:hypothetical protein